MIRNLFLVAVSLALSACVGLNRPKFDPLVPDGPITDQTSTAGCATNVIADFPGRKGRGTSTLYCSKSLSEVQASIAKLDQKDTLLVLDIDDTLLTSPIFFGSDSWFGWVDKEKTPDEAKPRCKFPILALSFEAGVQIAPEDSAGVSTVNAIPMQKLILTSRGANYRGGTERELVHAGYDFPKNLLADNDGISWTQVDRNGKQAPVSYSNGILMVTGVDKGEALVQLLNRLEDQGRRTRFKNIVLIDDGKSNINALHKAMPARGFNYHGYWYTRVTKGPRKDSDDVVDAEKGLASWNELLKDVYSDRLTRWEDRCD